MKSPVFSYRRAESLDDALTALAEGAGEARVLAGGQSLLAMMNLRLAQPSVLVDIGRVGGLDGIERRADGLHVGALVTHRALELAGEGETGAGFGVIGAAARQIGHYPIRTRGTIGGSVAHADPAAEWCMLSLALDAQIRVRSLAGERVLAAETFFQGPYSTALEPTEIITEIHFPGPSPHAALTEHARRHGDFALAAACVRLDVTAGTVTDARVVLGGVAGTPLRVPDAEAALVGSTADAEAGRAAARAAAAAIDPPADVHVTSAHRRRLATTLVRRACEQAAIEPKTGGEQHV